MPDHTVTQDVAHFHFVGPASLRAQAEQAARQHDVTISQLGRRGIALALAELRAQRQEATAA